MTTSLAKLCLACLILITCTKAPTPSTPPNPEVPETPAPALPEPPLEKLQKDILEESRRQISDFLIKNSDDPNLISKLEAIDALTDDLSRQIDGLETKIEPLTAQERSQYKALENLLDMNIKRREAEIAASYEEHRVEFKTIDVYDIPPPAEQELWPMRSHLKLACNSRRKIIVLGFGCSEGPPSVTKRISSLRAEAVKNWLAQNAGCKKGHILSEGMGVEVLEKDISTVDPADRKLLLEKSRHAVLLLPRQPSFRTGFVR